MILLDFLKIACALCYGIGALRFDAGRVQGASRCAARAVRVARRNAAERVPPDACWGGFWWWLR